MYIFYIIKNFITRNNIFWYTYLKILYIYGYYKSIFIVLWYLQKNVITFCYLSC